MKSDVAWQLRWPPERLWGQDATSRNQEATHWGSQPLGYMYLFVNHKGNGRGGHPVVANPCMCRNSRLLAFMAALGEKATPVWLTLAFIIILGEETTLVWPTSEFVAFIVA